MPPKADKEAIFFLISAGKSPPGGDVNYFEKAKEVMTLIIEKKIFLRPIDEVGVMLAADSEGAESRDNQACTELYFRFHVPTWNTVHDVQKLKQSKKIFDDWNTALANTVKQMSEAPDDCRLILILLFDCHPTCPGIKNIDSTAIAETILDMKIKLLWIGSKPLEFLPADKLNESERVLMNVFRQANGKYMMMDGTLPALRIFKNNKTRYIPWKCDLEIGNIKIPISMFVQATKPMKAPSFQTVGIKVENDVEKSVIVKPEREYVDKYKEAHSVGETISGYMYGRQCIPVPEADKEGMEYDAGPKSIKVYGFIPKSAIALEDLCGETSRIVIPKQPLAVRAFYCLAQAMNDANRVAVVRRIFRKGNAPKMGFLVPFLVPGDPWGFIYIELLYSEDRRVQQSRPLTSVKKRLTKEKEAAVGQLIDSMMLKSSEDKPEPFGPGTVNSPGLQYLYNCLSHRALNPPKPLPEMTEYLKSLIEPPNSITINSEPVIKILRVMFPIPDEEDLKKRQEETTAEESQPESPEAKKLKIDEDSNNSFPEDSNVDLDELFNDDMDM